MIPFTLKQLDRIVVENARGFAARIEPIRAGGRAKRNMPVVPAAAY
jgi:hypothetical protein